MEDKNKGAAHPAKPPPASSCCGVSPPPDGFWRPASPVIPGQYLDSHVLSLSHPCHEHTRQSPSILGRGKG